MAPGVEAARGTSMALEDGLRGIADGLVVGSFACRVDELGGSGGGGFPRFLLGVCRCDEAESTIASRRIKVISGPREQRTDEEVIGSRV
jgi:hypothetical protein